MRTRALILIAGAILVGCDRAPEPAGKAPPASSPIPAACMRNLPGDPVEAARADVARGIVHLYSHFQNGVGAGPVTPGVYDCPGPAPPRDGHHVPWVNLPVSIDEARTREEMAHSCDAPEILDACGQRQELYMRRYNLEVVRLRPPAIRSQCRGMIIEGNASGGG